MDSALPLFSRRRALLAAVAALSPRPSPGRTVPAAPAGESRFAPMLASVYAGQIEPARCLISEKYDGVRAVWDGRVLRHRSGRPVSAPASFLASLPDVPLDGELWLRHGAFDALSAIVRKTAPRVADWQHVRYMVFEMPGAGATFAERAARIASLVDARPADAAAHLEAVAQVPGGDRADLQHRLDAVVAAGGEGLVLHVATAPEVSGRSDLVMKLKPHLDAEALVVGQHAGSGKNRQLLGALEVETPERVRFLLGSGFSDAERRSPPPVGSSVTYRYRDVTPHGVPRFATFLRRADPL